MVSQLFPENMQFRCKTLLPCSMKRKCSMQLLLVGTLTQVLVYLGRSELGTRVQPQCKLNLHSNSVNFGIKDENIYIVYIR